MTNRSDVHPAAPSLADGARTGGPRHWLVRGVAIVVALVLVAGAGAVSTNALGAGDRWEGLVDRVALIVDPPPDRPTRALVTVTPRPTATATAAPSPTDAPTSTPRRTAAPPDATPQPTRPPTPSPSPSPRRVPVDVQLAVTPERVFQTQLTKDWCAPAGVQITLAALGIIDNSEARQHEIAGRLDEWEARADSQNGGWGPAAIGDALAAYGAEYELRAYETRADALRDSAAALSRTGAPVVIIAWRGAHTWVMTGYRANADPTIFPDASVTGAYIYDPWYPRFSSIWGQSDPPGTFQDAAEMKRNFRPWERPEGKYPDRDGKFLVLVPTDAVRPRS